MRNPNQTRTQNGFTLTELMIAIMLGMSVISSVLIGYLATYSGSVSTLANSKLSQEMATLMDVMLTDIRRAGFTADVASMLDPTVNPHSQIDSTALEVFNALDATDVGTNGDGLCITYSYDLDGLGGAVDANELFGFRLNNGVVQTRTLGNTADPDTCATASNTWADLTDPGFINVTNLNFDLVDAVCLNVEEPNSDDEDGDGTDDNDEEYDCYDVVPAAGSGDITVETRQVLITLEGELANDSFVKMTMSQSVRVRNDMVRVR